MTAMGVMAVGMLWLIVSPDTVQENKDKLIDSLSEMTVGGETYEINTKDIVEINDNSLTTVYDFRGEVFYSSVKNRDGFQITPFSLLNKLAILEVKNNACSIAREANQKFQGLNPSDQEVVKNVYIAVQAFNDLHCKL
jgi:hypothetical protein